MHLAGTRENLKRGILAAVVSRGMEVRCGAKHYEKKVRMPGSKEKADV